MGGKTLHVIISRTQQRIETTLVYQFWKFNKQDLGESHCNYDS